MSTFYLDTSALVKRYIDEPGSTWVRQICDASDNETNAPLHVIMIASITVVEAVAALFILERRNVIRKTTAERAYERFFDDFENAYQITAITSDLLLNAASLARRYPLKAYDAVQLALALNTKETLAQNEIELTFVSGDNQLLQAAQVEGLAVENPFTYFHLDNSPQEKPQ